ncbi:MAG: SpoIID/LytB domain-containing protein, partial [Acidimicrobiia bacterium]|nr:SpoIID/LytB domain-containing protein [Acidimicrobiia bacterium]
MRTARFRFPTRWEAGSTGPPASHRLAAAVMVFTLFPTVTPEEPPTLAGDTVTISADQGVRIVVDDVRYAGPLSVVGTSAGLGLTEATTLDRYLEGIAEVPFGWPEEALRAQAVAARTYLAWTLGRGRTSSGRRYGYDICATTQCQVYSGVGVVEGWGGDRWKRAVESTGSEILLHEGEPAQALYSSTSGGRTRSVEDVFPGASPTPYLRAVESPGEDSPFVDWGFELNERDMATLLREAGLLQGALIGVETVTTADGGGAWRVEVIGTDGVTSIGTWELRTALNRAAPSLEGLLPVMRPDVDRPYPQTILSPTFTIESYADFIPPIDGPPRIEKVYTFDGHGWGHLVGMSQFGAEAMARGGAGYAEILAHFYGGLEPVSGTGILPSQVVVGLATERDSLEVGADGPVSISLDGEPIADGV